MSVIKCNRGLRPLSPKRVAASRVELDAQPCLAAAGRKAIGPSSLSVDRRIRGGLQRRLEACTKAQNRSNVLQLNLVQLVTDKETNQPRGYAFIEYVHTREMTTAYEQADGRKLGNR
ncbi:uncharacterized protein LOC121989605 [Zingiber officinale]|uniref:uncharacterized protein LOC121989605 n=1 Tax=Zingiber officinale TaxID=94328 RepID=UPI001C4C898B|nr:uncharacterized protein LOC121989605 [Zingiber officinale]